MAPSNYLIKDRSRSEAKSTSSLRGFVNYRKTGGRKADCKLLGLHLSVSTSRTSPAPACTSVCLCPRATARIRVGDVLPSAPGPAPGQPSDGDHPRALAWRE